MRGAAEADSRRSERWKTDKNEAKTAKMAVEIHIARGKK